MEVESRNNQDNEMDTTSSSPVTEKKIIKITTASPKEGKKEKEREIKKIKKNKEEEKEEKRDEAKENRSMFLLIIEQNVSVMWHLF